MDNAFLKYMNDRLSLKEGANKKHGSVITIAREYGCYSTQIAELLVEKINKHNELDWKCVSDQVLNDVAKKLHVPVSKISHIFGANEKGFVEDFFSSFSVNNQNISDSIIIKTITDVMASYTKKGRCVIVGRAGVIFSKNNPKSLHIRLVAPLDWRIEQIQKRYLISSDQALKQIQEIDEKRKQFMSFFEAYRRDEELFDAILNRAKLSNEEIVDIIYDLAQRRNLLQ